MRLFCGKSSEKYEHRVYDVGSREPSGHWFVDLPRSHIGLLLDTNPLGCTLRNGAGG